MGQTVFLRGFASGELAPALTARADLPKYQTAARTVRNFIVRKQGGVANRPGTKFVAETKASGGARAYLFPFLFPAAGANFIIEAGDNYFRFYKNGAPIRVSGVAAYDNAHAYVVGDLASSGGVNYYCKAATTGNAPPNATYWYPLTGAIYEIPTPYPAGAFATPNPAGFSQQGVIVTITHLNYAPLELTYTSDTRWTLTPIVTGGWAVPPVAGAGTPGAAGTRIYSYVVTARRDQTYEETDPSAAIVVASALEPTVDAPNVVAWSAVAGAVQYDVYCDDAQANGVYGYVGSAIGVLNFRHTGAPATDFTTSPPIPRVLFNSANHYPAASCVYQQRRIMAGTHTDREQVYASQVGFRNNFGIRVPLQDDDAVTFTIASQYIQPVHFLITLTRGLVVCTDSSAQIILGDQAGTLTPTAINPRTHGRLGFAQVEPVVIGETIVYLQGRGTVLRDLRFDVEVEGLRGRDLTMYAAHLFAPNTIVDLAYAETPDSVVWAVRSDGALLGLTYVQEEDVWGWHRHDTDGSFEQVCTIPEGNEDAVYVVVKRTIGANVRRYVERFATRAFTDVRDAFFVDAGITYDGAATTVVAGLTHLASKAVKVLADGVPLDGTFTVAGNAITLPTAASKVQVGLPIVADLETLDLDVAGSSIRDKQKAVKSISLLLEASARGFFAGPDALHLLEQVANAWDVADADGRTTGQIEMNITSGFSREGRTLIRHTDPTPLTILGVLPNVELGG